MNLQSNKAKIAVGLVLVAMCVAVWMSPLRAWLTVENVATAVKTIGTVWYAPILFVLAFSLACILFLPATVFIVSAGLIWGGWPGSMYALMGAVLGATVSFHLSRFIGGDILAKLGKPGAQLKKVLEHAGFSGLLILRLIPFFPYPVVNYGAGVAGVRARDFVVSTALGITPPILVITFSAEALFSGLLSKEDALLRVVVVCVSAVILLVGVPFVFRRRAARALHLESEVGESQLD